MNTIILVLGENYQGINIPIDASTLHYYGHTAGDYYSGKPQADSSISFVPVGDIDKEQLATDLKNILRLNVNKDEYVHLRTKFEDYETDKRPRISVRLPHGYAGIANPAQFWLTANYRGLSSY